MSPESSFDAPSPLERLFNRLFGVLVGLGLGLPHNYQLQVRGRRSGRLYSTPVDVLSHEGKRFLVAGRGETRTVQRYFPVPAGSPVEAFAPLAARYPVFELIPT